MFATLALFEDIIAAVEILLQEHRTGLSKTKLKVVLKDGSILFLREIVIENILFDYSYHWQSPNNVLIIRWDNAAHYPNISTFPHHKHVESENNVLLSEEQSLSAVLNFIRNKIGI
jgi:hypothetical protein